MESITIREHSTSDIIMILEKNEVVIDLNGVDHVVLAMVDNNGKVFSYSSSDVSPAFRISDATDGQVTFTPPSETTFKYQNTPYRIYVWVYETSIKKYSCPENGYSIIYLERDY